MTKIRAWTTYYIELLFPKISVAFSTEKNKYNGYFYFIFHPIGNNIRWKKGAKYEVQVLNGYLYMSVGIVFGI